MKDVIYRKRRNKMQWRKTLVAEYFAKGYTIRQIAEVVQREQELDNPPSTATIHKDIQENLAEWRKERIENTDDAVSLELQRIDMLMRELWLAWEKSKKDITLTQNKRKGALAKGGDVTTTQVEESKKQEVLFGDPRYLSEVRHLIAERAKLLGLYAPEKRELSGEMGFLHFLQMADVYDGSEGERQGETA